MNHPQLPNQHGQGRPYGAPQHQPGPNRGHGHGQGPGAGRHNLQASAPAGYEQPRRRYEQPAEEQYEQPAPRRGYEQPAPRPPARNGLGIAAMVLGLVGLPFFLTGLTAPVAIILGLIAVPLALVGLGRVRRREATNRGMARTGLVLGLACIVMGIWSIVVTVQAVGEAIGGPTATIAGSDGGEQQPSGPVPVGTSIDVGGLTVTVTGVEQRTQLGRRMTCAQVSYANQDADQAQRNPYDWSLRNTDGASVNATIYTGDDALDSGALAPGGSADGLVCFDMPRGDAAAVQYTASVLSSGPAAEWTVTR